MDRSRRLFSLDRYPLLLAGVADSSARSKMCIALLLHHISNVIKILKKTFLCLVASNLRQLRILIIVPRCYGLKQAYEFK